MGGELKLSYKDKLMTPVGDKGEGLRTLSESTILGSSLRIANTTNRRQMDGAIRQVGLEHTPGRNGGKGGKHDT